MTTEEQLINIDIDLYKTLRDNNLGGNGAVIHIRANKEQTVSIVKGDYEPICRAIIAAMGEDPSLKFAVFNSVLNLLMGNPVGRKEFQNHLIKMDHGD